MRKTNRILLLLTVSAGVLLISGCASTAAPVIPDVIQVNDAGSRHITVTGNEKVKVVPDVADIEFGVTTQADDAAKCQTDNSGEVDRVLEHLKSLGIEEKSIQTNNYQLSPRYDWSADTQTIIGYEMTTNITVTGLPLDQTGKLMSDSVNAGINYISAVSYRCSSYDASYQEALTLAIQSATTKAQAMAAAGSKNLGAVIAMEESRPNQAVRYSNYAKGAATEQAADMAVMPGEVDVEAEVMVTFELN